MFTVASKYRTILELCLVERLTYRSDFFFGTLLRFMPIITTIFLWEAVFAGSSETKIAGLTARQMVAYYLLVLVSRAFSSMPGLANGIAIDIREGNIKKYLTQPVNMIGFLFTMRLAHKLVYYGVAAGPFAIVFYLCREFFDGWPSPLVLSAYVFSLVLAFAIGFLFESLVGMLAFWVLEISSFNFIIIMLNYLLSGHMFPLDLFPPGFREVVRWLPFQYMAYFPAILFLQGDSMSTSELAGAIGGQAAMAFALFVLLQWAYRRGLVRYSAFGG
ncbi:MAG: ABC-2 family transporter protein [Planctomycetota bacterium]